MPETKQADQPAEEEADLPPPSRAGSSSKNSEADSVDDACNVSVDDAWSVVSCEHPQLADFKCPITSQIMKDPVVAEDKFTYERAAIEAWLAGSQTSPQTKQAMGAKLLPNETLQNAIETFSEGSARGDAFTVDWKANGMRREETRSVSVSAVPAGPGGDSSPQGHHKHGSATCARTSMSQALGKFFRELDPLRELLSSVLDGWTPPKIVVVGDESAGKSTLLEQLAMLPVFPRKRRFCTRSAIHLRLRRGPSCTARLSTFTVQSDFSHTPDGPAILVPQENGWLWVQEKMDELVQKFSSAKGGVIKNKIIVLEVSRPDLPSIDLVDTPGLTTVPKEKAEAVEKILKTQLDADAATGGHSIFVAVVPASGDKGPNVNTAMRFIQDNKLSEKAIGVFTKCDTARHSDILRSLITGDRTADGETAQELGAVHLGKGWIATMLEPPSDEELQTHNFERLIIQQNKEVVFFSQDENYKALRNQGLAGTSALIERLEDWYTDFLNNTWKNNAMEKVLEKLAEKKFDLKMLGLVSDSDKDELAKLEIERRMGPSSPWQSLHERFLSEKVNGSFVLMVKKNLESLNAEDTVWEPWTVIEQLQLLQQTVGEWTDNLLKSMKPFFLDVLQDLLTAECKVENDEDSLLANIFTVGQDQNFSKLSLRMLAESQPKSQVVEYIKNTPFIQLCHYKHFTDDIVKKCDCVFDDAVKTLSAECEKLIGRLTQLDSPWLKLKPHSITDLSGQATNKVKPSVDTQGFLDVLIVCIFSFTPAPGSPRLRNIHEGVAVGMETVAASEMRSRLMDEIAKIKQARDGIRSAFKNMQEATMVNGTTVLIQKKNREIHELQGHLKASGLSANQAKRHGDVLRLKDELKELQS